MKTKIALLLITLSAAALGQGLTGYAFFAPGRATLGPTGTMHFGAGADGVIGKGIGVGAEIGALSPWDCFSRCVLGMFSPNVSYHFFGGNERRVDPFVTAGYTLLFRDDSANLLNFGGGINYWFARRIGLRTEFRDHVHFAPRSNDHFWGFRFGLAFR